MTSSPRIPVLRSVRPRLMGPVKRSSDPIDVEVGVVEAVVVAEAVDVAEEIGVAEEFDLDEGVEVEIEVLLVISEESFDLVIVEMGEGDGALLGVTTKPLSVDCSNELLVVGSITNAS